jgi:uncharacterized protein with PIN domain
MVTNSEKLRKEVREMEKTYQHCPNCNRRMKRTGEKKIITSAAIVRGKLYQREYECPGCGRVWTHDELRNALY